MNEPTPPPNPAPTPAPTPNPDPPPTAPARPEYIPEKFWDAEKGAPNLEGMARSYSELERRFGATRPATVPESPDLYELKPAELPDGVEWNETAAAKFAAAFHQHGVSTEAAKEIGRLFAEAEAENIAAVRAAYDKQLETGRDALRKEWGPDYPTKLGKVKAIVGTLGYDPADADLFTNPKVVSFLGKVVGMLSEDAVASMRGAVAPGNTFASGTEEARAIMRDPKHPDYEAYHAGDRAVNAKVTRLLEQG